MERNNMSLGYTEPATGAFVKASSVLLRDTMRTAIDEQKRKACYEVLAPQPFPILPALNCRLGPGPLPRTLHIPAVCSSLTQNHKHKRHARCCLLFGSYLFFALLTEPVTFYLLTWCAQGMRTIGPFVVDKFCEIVKLRNQVAKAQGYEDYYDYKVLTFGLTLAWSCLCHH